MSRARCWSATSHATSSSPDPPGRRAFITTAHRGQNAPFAPQLTTPGVGRADVWVFNATNLGTSLGGTPLTIITLFSDTPRALAVVPRRQHGVCRGVRLGQSDHDRPARAQIPDTGEMEGGIPLPNVNACRGP